MLEHWPPDFLEEYRRRVKLFADIESSPRALAACMLHYKHNPIDFINDTAVTYDPRILDPMPRLMPFILFKRQREFVQFLEDCRHSKENGLVEKSRDIGASYISCAYTAWLWLLHPESMIGWGSRKEEYVDKKGDPKAIFTKIRQILEYMPHFLMPKDFNMTRDATYMKIINPENGSVISGEAGDSQGRGSRSTIYFLDEFAHCERPELIEASISDNTDVAIAISSVNGTNNVFYQKRMVGEVWYPDTPLDKGKTRVFIFDWRDSPLKSQEWYDTRKKRAEAEGLAHIFAQEVDRNYSAAIERIIIPPEWVNAAIDAHKVLGFEPNGEKVAGQDVADDGGDKNALVIRHGVVLRYAEHFGGDAGEAAQISIPICAEYGVRRLCFDSIGVGAGYKNEVNNMRERGSVPRLLLVTPWNAGASPIDPDDNIIPEDPQTPTNSEQYGNLKAQAWFRLRARFNKTYRAVRFGERADPDQLISIDSTIPRLHELKNELSQAQYKSSATNGKTLVDKKPSGAKSPNLADAIVMAYCPVTSVSIFDVL